MPKSKRILVFFPEPVLVCSNYERTLHHYAKTKDDKLAWNSDFQENGATEPWEVEAGLYLDIKFP